VIATRVLRVYCDEYIDDKRRNCAVLPVALPLTLFEALQGVEKSFSAVQVKLNHPSDNVVVLPVETTTPSLSVHM